MAFDETERLRMTSSLRIAGPMFGDGGAEPYEQVLEHGTGQLWLRHDGRDEHDDPAPLDVARWRRPADAVDRALLRGLHEPVLDAGSGPGRMVRAAVDAGLDALGVDVSAAAVRTSVDAGLPVVQADLFSPLPNEGAWGAVLLVDGNVGIGGDVDALLTRVAALLRRGGVAVVETHPDATRDERMTATLADAGGHVSERFPWAEIGADALVRRALRLGYALDARWTADGREFVRLERV